MARKRLAPRMMTGQSSSRKYCVHEHLTNCIIFMGSMQECVDVIRPCPQAYDILYSDTHKRVEWANIKDKGRRLVSGKVSRWTGLGNQLPIAERTIYSRTKKKFVRPQRGDRLLDKQVPCWNCNTLLWFINVDGDCPECNHEQ